MLDDDDDDVSNIQLVFFEYLFNAKSNYYYLNVESI